MAVVLGSGWDTLAGEPPPYEPPPDPGNDLLGKVLLAVEALQATFAQMPTPQLQLEPNDFTDIVTAVQDLKGPNGPSAQDIAQAIRETLVPALTPQAPPSLASEKMLEVLERLDFRMKGQIIAGGPSSVSVANQAGTALDVQQKQILDTNNTTTRTSTNGATQYVGTWSTTRSLGVQRCLVILASDVTSGLGGTFEFQFSEDGSTATVDETRVITDFATVRDFDLENVGAYFRVKFTPSRALTTGEHVYITTQFSTQYSGAFVRLANQELEEANAALPSTFAYVKAFDAATGKSTNVRSNRLGDLSVEDQSLGITESGSLFTESIRDDIRISFSRDSGVASLATRIQAVTGNTGTVTHDATQGQAVFATGAPAGRIAYYESVKTAVYEPGHTIRGEQTIQISALPTGTQTIEWGYGEDDGAGNVLNGVGWGMDATGLYTWRRKAGALVTQVRQTSFYDKLDGGTASRFRIMGVPTAYQPLKNALYRQDYEWLGVAPPQYLMMTPEGDFITVNIEATVNQMTGTTVPDPALALFVRVYNGAGGDLQVRSGSWRGGINTSKVVQTALNPNLDYADARIGGPLSNSPTPTPLAGSATYTSAWYQSTGYVSIEAVIATDQLSAGNGIELQFSDDGSTVRRTTFRTFNAADVTNGSKFFASPNQGNYFRIVYMNGGSAQGSFFINLRLNTTAIQQSIDNIEADINGTSSATMVRNVIAAKSDAGTYGNITRSTTAGALRVSIAEAEVPVAIKALTSWTTGQASVSSATTPVVAISSPMTGRKTFAIKALTGNSQTVYVGPSASLTTGNGYPLSPNEVVVVEVDETAAVYILGATSATQSVAFIQVG